MAWTSLAPTCNQSAQRVGIESIEADSITFSIPVCAPNPPYPYFLQANWNTGFVDVVATEDTISGEFGVPAPSDGSGTLSWKWEMP